MKIDNSNDNRIPIRDFPKYSVDRHGNVFNSKGKQLNPEKCKNGYLRVSLNSETVKRKHMLIHRLVGEAFISNPNDYPQINHKDLNRSNNNVNNLEWCTPLYNLTHAGVINKASIAKYRKIKCEDTGEVFDSVMDACKKYNLHHTNIVACCNGRRHTCGGKKWSYLT